MEVLGIPLAGDCRQLAPERVIAMKMSFGGAPTTCGGRGQQRSIAIQCRSGIPAKNILGNYAEKVLVKFVLQQECRFGQNFYVIGDDALLGAWDPASAIPLKWSENHVWTGEVKLPAGRQFEFKFILKHDEDEPQWQPGNNRCFSTHNAASTGLLVSGTWELGEQIQLQGETEQIGEALEEIHQDGREILTGTVPCKNSIDDMTAAKESQASYEETSDASKTSEEGVAKQAGTHGSEQTLEIQTLAAAETQAARSRLIMQTNDIAARTASEGKGQLTSATDEAETEAGKQSSDAKMTEEAQEERSVPEEDNSSATNELKQAETEAAKQSSDARMEKAETEETQEERSLPEEDMADNLASEARNEGFVATAAEEEAADAEEVTPQEATQMILKDSRGFFHFNFD